jgi:amidase
LATEGDVVEAAIARTEAVNATLTAWRIRHSTGPTPRWLGRHCLSALTFQRSAHLREGQRRRRRDADEAGHRRVHTARPADLDSKFTRLYLATGMTVVGKTQMSKCGSSFLAEHP